MRAASQRSVTAPSSPISIRAPDFAGEVGERSAAGARRHEVAAEMAERRQLLVRVGKRGETALRAAGDVLEEDALDRRLRAVAEDLVGRRLDQARAHGRTLCRCPDACQRLRDARTVRKP